MQIIELQGAGGHFRFQKSQSPSLTSPLGERNLPPPKKTSDTFGASYFCLLAGTNLLDFDRPRGRDVPPPSTRVVRKKWIINGF